MPWFKVDDAFHAHPKVADLSLAAVGTWLLAGTWASQYLTDGALSAKAASRLGATPETIRELVESGLWDETDSGYQFHDWDQFQPSKAEVEADRAAARERMRVARSSKKNVRANTRGTSSELPPHDDASSGEVRITPTRPDPTQPVPSDSSSKSQSAQKRGSRVDPGFSITPGMREWAAKEVPAIDIDRKLGEFIDYWAAVPGERGVKLDWESTWRNGMRKQQEFALRDGVAAPATPSPRRVVSGRAR